MAPATAYIRVSTIGQVEDGVSLDAQKAKVTAWCLANDVELGEVFVDAGLSGKRADNRPALQQALDAACRSAGVLVVYSLSRLARSTKDTIQIAERLEKAGADLVSLSEKIDTTTAAGKMVFRMLAVLAEFERDQISERTRMAMAHKRQRGERISRRIPYGYDLAPDGVALTENPSEQRVLARIASLRESGYTFQSIADELAREGILTKEGSNQWKPGTIHKILKRAA